MAVELLSPWESESRSGGAPEVRVIEVAPEVKYSIIVMNHLSNRLVQHVSIMNSKSGNTCDTSYVSCVGFSHLVVDC